MTTDDTDASKLLFSKLPQEILDFTKEELYVNRVQKNLGTVSKDELTEVSGISKLDLW